MLCFIDIDKFDTRSSPAGHGIYTVSRIRIRRGPRFCHISGIEIKLQLVMCSIVIAVFVSRTRFVLSMSEAMFAMGEIDTVH
jgi:hypothetical protein